MKVSLIAAVAENGVIGRGGQLPWHLAADLQRFKRLTMGHTIIMGRKTWESIGRPLPGRRMIVITRQDDYCAEGLEVASSLDAAIDVAAARDDEAYVIGGAEIYRQALPRADRLFLTRVQAIVEGDTTFPEFDPSHWRLVESEQHLADDKNEFPVCFERYERK
jgi:dihydrofolate reductase